MKLNIKIFIIWAISHNAFATYFPIHVNYIEHRKNAEIVRNILVDKFNIPKKFINVSKTEKCYVKKNAHFLSICIQKDEKLKVLNYNQSRLDKALGLFYKKGNY
jgi:hypothetical protein